MSATVVITHQQNIQDGIAAALGMLPVERCVRGKVVAIHPNDTSASESDTTAVTQPDTLEAVIRFVKRLAPRELIVSGGSGQDKTDDVFSVSGMRDVVRHEGVRYIDHNQPPFEAVPLEWGPLPEVQVCGEVLGYETIISLGQLKTHSQSVMVGAIKNIAMSWPAAGYYGHPRMANVYGRSGMVENKASFIVGMLKRFRPDISVVVGHPAMVGTGPVGGKAVETGLTIAGLDPVATDTVCASLLGFSSMAVEYLRQAAKLGLGEGELSRIEIRGVALDEAMRIFTERVYGAPMVLAVG